MKYDIVHSRAEDYNGPLKVNTLKAVLCPLFFGIKQRMREVSIAGNNLSRCQCYQRSCRKYLTSSHSN